MGIHYLDLLLRAESDGVVIFQTELSGVYDLAEVPNYIDTPDLTTEALTIESVSLIRATAGASGSTRVDVKIGVLNAGVWTFTSIFSGSGAMPSVAFSDGNYAISTKTVFVSDDLVSGNLLAVSLEAVEGYLIGPPEGPEGIRVEIRCRRPE